MPVNPDRAPSTEDDSVHDYRASGFPSIWRTSSQLLFAHRDVPGDAVWKPIASAGMLPLDVPLENAGAPIAAYGTRLLSLRYTADKCLDVRRLSDDRVLTIGFAGDLLNTAMLDAFCAGTSGRVVRWYDQSGHGNHAEMPIAEHQPLLDPACTIGRCRSIAFDTRMDGGTPADPSYAVRYRYLSLPPGVRVDISDCAIHFLGRARSCSRPAVFFSLAASGSLGLTMAGMFPPDAAAMPVGVHVAGVGHFSGQLAAMQEPAIGGLSTGSGFSVFYGDKYLSYPPPPSQMLAGGCIGGSQYNVNGYTELSDLIVWPHYNTVVDVTAIHGALYGSAGVCPQIRSAIVFDGDSIMQGGHEVANQNLSRQTMRLLDRPAVSRNVAVFGDTLTNRIAVYPSMIAPLHNRLAPANILIQAAGSNDLVLFAMSADVLYENLRRFAACAGATGFKIVVCTVLPRADLNAAARAEWERYNALLRANWPHFADGFADFQADPVMGSLQATHEPTLYPDGIHPSGAGYARLAPLLARSLQSLLP